MSRDRLTKREKNLAKGSIFDVADTRNERPEDVLAEADVLVMLDESGSMAGRKHEEAVAALRTIQEMFPGRVVLISFASAAKWHFNGLPSSPGGGTNTHLALEKGLEFGQIPGTKVYLISDGHPNYQAEQPAYDIAEKYEVPISTIYIGPETDQPGMQFMEKIAKITGGTSRDRVDVADLEHEVKNLLLTEGKKDAR